MDNNKAAHANEWDAEEPLPVPWTAEQVQALREKDPVFSITTVLFLQACLGLLLTALIWLLTQRLNFAWSAGYGVLVVFTVSHLCQRFGTLPSGARPWLGHEGIFCLGICETHDDDWLIGLVVLPEWFELVADALGHGHHDESVLDLHVAVQVCQGNEPVCGSKRFKTVNKNDC